MSDEVVLVNRKNHPSNPVRVNKSEMLKDDVIVGSKPVTVKPVKESKKKDK